MQVSSGPAAHRRIRGCFGHVALIVEKSMRFGFPLQSRDYDERTRHSREIGFLFSGASAFVFVPLTRLTLFRSHFAVGSVRRQNDDSRHFSA
jgi:hypothetical protein